MTAETPKSWRCQVCEATDGFLVTIDRVVHVGKRHVGKVVDGDGNLVTLEAVK